MVHYKGCMTDGSGVTTWSTAGLCAVLPTVWAQLETVRPFFIILTGVAQEGEVDDENRH